jgi:hypothetical protein
VDPIQEWAWRQYDWCARNVPNTDQSRAAWKIHLAAGRIPDMVVKTRDVPETVDPPTMVIAASSMNTEQFAAHFTKRHKGSLADLSELPANMPHEIEQMYRAFHRRLHEIRRYRHEHEEEDIEIGVDRAIEALFENHNWGWKQLAGLDGCLVAVFPDGQIATSVNGKIKHHNEIDEATDRLVSVLD